MNLLNLIPLFLLVLLALALVPVAVAAGKKAGRQVAWNTANIHPDGQIPLKPGEAFATRFLLGTRGSSADEVDIAAAGELPLCIVEDTADSTDVTNGEPVNCALLGATKGTKRVATAGAVPDDTDLYSVGGGQVDVLANAAEGDYRVGRSVGSTSGADVITFIPELPTYTKPGA